MFGNEKFEEKKPTGGKYISYGNQQIAITGFEVKTSKNGDAWQIILNTESPTVTEEGFEPDESATRNGKVGRVKLDDTYYKVSEDKKQLNEFDAKMQNIATKVGVDITTAKTGATSFEDYMNKVLPLIKGKDFIAQVCAKEYTKADGKIGYTLHLGRYGYAASLTEGLAHLKPFNKDNEYHYEKVEAAPTNGVAVPPQNGKSPW